MVIALDRHKKPLGFITERRCRKLIEAGRGCICRYYPMALIIKDADSREMEKLPSYRIKIDPGAKYTGIAIVCNETDKAVYFMQIEHRGDSVRMALDTRRMTRRNRRSRETRYRRSKFKDGGKFTTSREEGWLPPSVRSTADNVIHWVKKTVAFCKHHSMQF